jgi:aspartyl-tRNA(Asn)/glutamyl-tRNA(Gln) amidotransferase subunit A
VPNAGCVPLGYSLDHIGALARSARDCGAFVQAIAGPDPRDPYAAEVPVPGMVVDADGSLAGLRIGVERVNHLSDTDDPAVAPAFEAAVATLEALGATVVELEIPLYAETTAATWVSMLSEALAYHMPDLRSRPQDYFAATRGMVAAGALFSGADYVQAQRVRRVAQRGLAELFTGVDLIATPGAARGATPLQELRERGVGGLMGVIHTAYWDAVGNPALVVPMGFTADGLPLSLQLGARPFEEDVLVRAGDAFQSATDWHLRVPPLALDAVGV